MTRFISGTTLLLSAFALGACASGGEPAYPSMSPWSPDTLTTATGDTVPVQRAGLTVPEDWEDPGPDSVTLTVLRIPGTSSPTDTPVVYLAGGPGGSAIQTARGERWPLFDALRQAGDVILMDQRGTSGADPFLLCPSGLDIPLEVPGTRANLFEAWTAWSRACAAAWEEDGVDLAAYHSRAAARDLDALRRGLHTDRVDLVAVSYGTQLAQAFARAFPRAVGRIVLAGPEPLDRTLKPAEQTEAQLARLDSAVAADPDASRVVGEFTDLVASVLHRLEQEPARVPVVDPRTGDSAELAIGAYDVRLLTAFSLGDRQAMLRLPALYLAMDAGRFHHVAPLIVRFRRYNATAMAATTDCATGWSAADSAAVVRAAESSLLADAANFPFPDICAAWPHRDLGAGFRSSFQSDAPVLFIAGTMDGRTPPANISSLTGTFPDHSRLIIRGGAHDDDLFLSAPEIIPALVTFLRSGTGGDRVVELEPWRFPVGR